MYNPRSLPPLADQNRSRNQPRPQPSISTPLYFSVSPSPGCSTPPPSRRDQTPTPFFYHCYIPRGPEFIESSEKKCLLLVSPGWFPRLKRQPFPSVLTQARRIFPHANPYLSLLPPFLPSSPLSSPLVPPRSSPKANSRLKHASF